ncbi:MAG: ribulokinase [Deltaproteobacteria bacterium]|nr:ribulokinase [Deltaproteobacteria bacterium]MBT4641171.1 ribulokinase [Deltaproteobacteria bacterium]MBT6502688.1 ribulokinase [Deltaproteobacteria bacterium]MBT6613729.1 ribulokinase [Deltaproteobacteria bacterium]MBT7153931.1 ribulokinase [Deltaproteobacteria bacterium]
MSRKYVLGLDYGTDSVRAVLVNTETGQEASSDVCMYPRWSDGLYCDPVRNQFRQHPLDYLESLKQTVKKTIAKGPAGIVHEIAAIAIDTTGSTPVAVDKDGTALALREEFKENPNAMFILWKDHTAVNEAAEINELARSWGGEDFTQFSGGIYSSEWFWSKILHTLREDKAVGETAVSWVEHCDWIPAVLTGNLAPMQIKRSRCAAGHKAMWHESWDGLPGEEFLIQLDPLLTGLRENLYRDTYTADQAAGGLTEQWAEELGLPAGLPVGVGAFDAHMGAVGGEIRPYAFVKVIGTSTCDMLVVDKYEVGSKLVKGICGQVDGSIFPGMIGMEAGQSAFGDLYAWFRDILAWPLELVGSSDVSDAETRERLVREISDRIIPELSKAAETIPVGESGIVAIDWLNGRRTPDANQALKGALFGLNLGSDAPKLFRALVEATAFGTKKIVDRFIEEGIRIDEIIAIGGVAKKSPFAMQVVADVLNMEIKVARSEQTVALGAAMFAAVVAGIFDRLEDAQAAMGCGFETVYHPIPEHVEQYRALFARYTRIGDFIEKELT